MIPPESSQWAKVTALISIKKELLWRVLTQPELTERYMYNCQLHSNWKIGDKAVWKNKTEDGKWQEHVEASVLVYQPFKHLAFTIYHKSTDHFPETQSELHFYLIPQKNGLELRIEQGDFARIEGGDERCEKCQQGWEYVLPKLVETCNSI